MFRSTLRAHTTAGTARICDPLSYSIESSTISVSKSGKASGPIGAFHRKSTLNNIYKLVNDPLSVYLFYSLSLSSLSFPSFLFFSLSFSISFHFYISLSLSSPSFCYFKFIYFETIGQWLSSEVLPAAKMEEFFQLDVEQMTAEFRKEASSYSSSIHFITLILFIS